MNDRTGAKGLGRALEAYFSQAHAQPVGLAAESARACIDAKTFLKNLARGDLSPIDDETLAERLKVIEERLPTRQALLPRPTAAQLVLILDVNEVFASPLRDEAPHLAQRAYVDRIFDAAASQRLKALDTKFSPLYVPLPAWNAAGEIADLVPHLKVGGLEFVAENLHPASASLGRTLPEDGPRWEQIGQWLAVNREAQSTWVVFQHVDAGEELGVPDECRPYVVQRPAGRPFSDGDREALEAALARRLVEVKTAEGRGIP